MVFFFVGARGQKAYDVEEFAGIVKGLMDFSLETEGVREFDINPLFIYNDNQKAKAVDIKIILKSGSNCPNGVSICRFESVMNMENKKLKILIVDDDVDLREMYAEVFSNSNYEVIEAEDGVEGLDKATKEIPDIIFTEL